MIACEYFALCDREAVGTVPNPVLGPVPCCQRCADRVETELDPFPPREECQACRGRCYTDGPCTCSTWCELHPRPGVRS